MEERGLGIGRALAYGALAGLIVIAAAGAYLWYRTAKDPRSAGASDVIVVLALPDEEGVVLPRVIDRYADGEVTPIDPLATATVPGTSYNVLREAYPFSGAKGLATALVGDAEQARPSYVLVDEQAWETLAGNAPIQLDVPEHMDVFDGIRVYTFREGEQEVDPDEVAALFKGADYLGEKSRAQIREEVGAYLRDLLEREGAGAADTDLSDDQLAEWVGAL